MLYHRMTHLFESIASLPEAFADIDILVNNGGISFRGEITSTTLEVDVRLMKTNYFGAVALTKALLPSMIQRKSGHVVMIGSVQSKLAIPFRFI